MKNLSLLVMALSWTFCVHAQRSIAVIGSSTAWGKGATAGHSWLELTKAYLKSKGLIDTVYNLAYTGLTTWDGMPTGSPHPTGSDSADPKRNVTKALAFRPLPKAVIVSYPSNDIYEGYTITQYLANLRLIYNTVVAANSICFVTTTQPRNNMGPALRNVQRAAADSIEAEYGVYALNFYDTLTDRYSKPDSLSIKAQYGYGDGIHVNDSGHMALFQIVKASDALLEALTLEVSTPTVTVQSGPVLQLQWTAAHADSPIQFYVQRAADTLHFGDIGETDGRGSVVSQAYSYTDAGLLSGVSYYRIRASENGKDSYTPAVSYFNSGKDVGLINLYATPGGHTVIAEIAVKKDQTMQLAVFNSSGMVVWRRQIAVSAPVTRYSIDIPGMAAGEYFVRLIDGGGQKYHRAFMKF